MYFHSSILRLCAVSIWIHLPGFLPCRISTREMTASKSARRLRKRYTTRFTVDPEPLINMVKKTMMRDNDQDFCFAPPIWPDNPDSATSDPNDDGCNAYREAAVRASTTVEPQKIRERWSVYRLETTGELCCTPCAFPLPCWQYVSILAGDWSESYAYVAQVDIKAVEMVKGKLWVARSPVRPTPGRRGLLAPVADALRASPRGFFRCCKVLGRNVPRNLWQRIWYPISDAAVVFPKKHPQLVQVPLLLWKGRYAGYTRNLAAGRGEHFVYNNTQAFVNTLLESIKASQEGLKKLPPSTLKDREKFIRDQRVMRYKLVVSLFYLLAGLTSVLYNDKTLWRALTEFMLKDSPRGGCARVVRDLIWPEWREDIKVRGNRWHIMLSSPHSSACIMGMSLFISVALSWVYTDPAQYLGIGDPAQYLGIGSGLVGKGLVKWFSPIPRMLQFVKLGWASRDLFKTPKQQLSINRVDFRTWLAEVQNNPSATLPIVNQYESIAFSKAREKWRFTIISVNEVPIQMPDRRFDPAIDRLVTFNEMCALHGNLTREQLAERWARECSAVPTEHQDTIIFAVRMSNDGKPRLAISDWQPKKELLQQINGILDTTKEMQRDEIVFLVREPESVGFPDIWDLAQQLVTSPSGRIVYSVGGLLVLWLASFFDFFLWDAALKTGCSLLGLLWKATQDHKKLVLPKMDLQQTLKAEAVLEMVIAGPGNNRPRWQSARPYARIFNLILQGGQRTCEEEMLWMYVHVYAALHVGPPANFLHCACGLFNGDECSAIVSVVLERRTDAVTAVPLKLMLDMYFGVTWDMLRTMLDPTTHEIMYNLGVSTGGYIPPKHPKRLRPQQLTVENFDYAALQCFGPRPPAACEILKVKKPFTARQHCPHCQQIELLKDAVYSILAFVDMLCPPEGLPPRDEESTPVSLAVEDPVPVSSATSPSSSESCEECVPYGLQTRFDFEEENAIPLSDGESATCGMDKRPLMSPAEAGNISCTPPHQVQQAHVAAVDEYSRELEEEKRVLSMPSHCCSMQDYIPLQSLLSK